MASFVINLIWKGFPQTVDKLEPEVGDIQGPRPVLLISCDVEILQSSSVGVGKLSKQRFSFGVEQVIIVRHDDTKKSLQNINGDVALILTVLESKGIEFDDIILWDFFSTCTDQAGIRSLVYLKDDFAKFDPRQYSGMCAELKNLYVAITRARMQLFIVETSESTAVIVKSLLVRHNCETLTEVTCPDQDDFIIRVKMMRPSTSLDPLAWGRTAQKLMEQHLFKDAIMPFRRAGDYRGERLATAKFLENEAETCKACGDKEGTIRNIE